MFDDTDLIDELRDGMRERSAPVHLPDGVAAEIRGRVRRRRAGRAAAAGVPVLVAAGVVTALAVGGGPATPRESTSNPPNPAGRPAIGGPGHAVDTAYIVRRARAALAGAPDRVLVSSGPTFANWLYYDAATGVQDQRTVNISGGTQQGWSATVATPVDHVLHFHTVSVLDTPASDGTSADDVVPGHTWSVTDTVASAPEATGGPPVDLASMSSDGAQIERALQSGDVHQDGTATVDGRSAIRLALPTLSGTTSTLYVDARTDVPLEEVDVHALTPSGTSTTIERWLPATPANIALARPQPIPAGYTRVKAQG